jgi:hypothetical protein
MGIYDNNSDEEVEAIKKVPEKVKKPRKKKTVVKKKTNTKKKTSTKKKQKIVEKTEIHSNSDSTNTVVEYPDRPKITPEEFFAQQVPKPEYIKHLIKCRCVLPQFNKMEEPPDHQFIVFSVLDNKGEIKPHYAQCNNCGLIHKIFEVGVSQTLKKESLMSLPTKKDLKSKLTDWLVEALEEHECELHVWQEAEFILKHKIWGRFIVLARERDEQMVLGKIMQILGENLYNIETFEQDENYVEP